MKKQFIYLATALFFTLAGCSKSTENDLQNGAIGLSTTDTIRFAGIKDTVRVQTKGTSWWFSRIKVDGAGYQLPAASKDEQPESLKFSQTWDWLTVIRETNQIMLIAATNNTDRERTFELFVESATESATIRGTQRLRYEGEWEDCIGLSEKKVNIPAEGGSVKVETKESWWWVNSIEVDGVITDVNSESSAQLEKEKEYLKRQDWLTIHITGKKIELTAGPNTTGKERSFRLNLEAGDYFDTITGVQEK